MADAASQLQSAVYPPVPAADGDGLYYPRHDPAIILAEGFTHEQLDRELDELDEFALNMESKWRVFDERIQVGLDTFVNFIPLLGNIATGVCSLHVIKSAQNLRIATWRVSVMQLNAIIAFGLGMVPFLGALFNAWFACIRRNTNHVLYHFGRKPVIQPSLFVADNAICTPETPYPENTAMIHNIAFFPPPPLDPFCDSVVHVHDVPSTSQEAHIPYPSAPSMLTD